MNRDSRQKNKLPVFGSFFPGGMQDILDFFPSSTSFTSDIPVKVSEKDGFLFVKFRVPGIKQENIDLSLENNILTLQIKQESTTEEDDESVYKNEFYMFEATRSVRLPKEIEMDSSDVELKGGELIFKAKVAEKEKAKKFSIKSS
jgi:HSP20 family protein